MSALLTARGLRKLHGERLVFDIADLTNTDPKGFIRAVERYHLEPWGLYMARSADLYSPCSSLLAPLSCRRPLGAQVWDSERQVPPWRPSSTVILNAVRRTTSR